MSASMIGFAAGLMLGWLFTKSLVETKWVAWVYKNGLENIKRPRFLP